MTFEIAIATMHKTIEEVKSMLDVMNIHCDCLVVNQCDKEDFYEENTNRHLRIFFTKERGLSKSRNMALRNSQADILAIGDDDLFYYDDFDKIIIGFYNKNNSVDVGLFNIDHYRKKFPSIDFKCKFWHISSFMSVQCTFRLSAIRKKNVKFNEFFGSGAEEFNSGEENIFLSECKKNNLNIYYCSKKILKCEETESTWFTGFNDKKFIMTRGATYYSISKLFFYPYIIRFAIKYKKKLKPYSIFDSLKLMEQGKKRVKELSKRNYNEK